jgi:hypothetical protein
MEPACAHLLHPRPKSIFILFQPADYMALENETGRQIKKGTKVIADRSGCVSRLLVGLHDCIGNEGGRYLISAKPATI